MVTPPTAAEPAAAMGTVEPTRWPTPLEFLRLRCPICRAPIDDVLRVFLACAAAEEPAGVELP